ncbi:MAG: glycoside hydrolase family 6 protein, partial [Acidimicrobiia bacterium]
DEAARPERTSGMTFPPRQAAPAPPDPGTAAGPVPTAPAPPSAPGPAPTSTTDVPAVPAEVAAPARPPRPAPDPWLPATLFVAPDGQAAAQALAWQGTDPAGAALMQRVAAVAQARWFANDGGGAVRGAVDAHVAAAAAARAMPVLVLYRVPKRDCGSHSGGGAASPEDYAGWVREVAAGIGDRPAVVVLEPDALLHLTKCLTPDEQEARLALLRDAVAVLAARPAVHVYLDAGTAGSHTPAAMAARLDRAGIDRADGFSVNVAGFHTTEANVAYGTALSALVGGAHFVVDTSRNGAGPTDDRQWCNPPGRALGSVPEVAPGVSPLVDAFLWVKTPGRSDGTCNGGPKAGDWWPEYLADLARRAGW